MPRRWSGVPRSALGLLGLAACYTAPAAGVRLLQRYPDDRREFLFYPPGEEPDASELLDEMKRRKSMHLDHRGAGGDADEPPKTRLLFGKWRAGFDDTFSRILTLMKLAMVANARLVLPAPSEILEHGNVSFAAASWDEYFKAEPGFYRRTKPHRCPGRVKRQFWNASRLEEEIRLGNASILFDHSKVFCVQLRGNGRDKPIWEAPEMVSALRSLDRAPPRLYVSSGIAQYANKVLEELGPRFSAVHVRQGDRGSPHCTSPEFVSELMARQGKADKWLVASDGNSSWFDELLANASSMQMDVVTELQQPSLASLQDNYFRYGVEKCMFSAAEHFIDTYHNVGFGCMPVIGQKSKRGTYLLCPEGSAA